MRPPGFRAEREFGLIVGAVFVLLGLWWIYRGKFINAAYVLTILGAALILFGIVVPRVLILPRKGWMKLAEALAYVSSCVILSRADADWGGETSNGLGSALPPDQAGRLLLASVSATRSAPLRENVLATKRHKNHKMFFQSIFEHFVPFCG
jgi:hypothetical protein